MAIEKLLAANSDLNHRNGDGIPIIANAASHSFALLKRIHEMGADL